jgi:hypothetical protein
LGSSDSAGAAAPKPSLLKFTPYSFPGLSLIVCLERAEFISQDPQKTSPTVSLGPTELSLAAGGTIAGYFAIPAGAYSGAKLVFSPRCASGKSLQLTNSLGAIASSEEFAINASGSITVNGQGQIQIAAQAIVDALSSVAAADQVGVTLQATTIAITSLSLPYNGVAVSLPGTIQAEDFDEGGPGVAYYDSSEANARGEYRPGEGVDIESCDEGGYNITHVFAQEWMNYTVNVTQSGSYTMEVRAAVPNGGRNFRIEIDGAAITPTVAAPYTGGWQNWSTIIIPNIPLTSGTHILRFYTATGGINLNFIRIQ